MARAKNKTTEEIVKSETPPSTPVVDPMSSKEIVYEIFDQTFGRYDRGIPVLLGESNWGKTWTVREYARERGYGMTTLLLQTQEPETIQGYDIKETQPDGRTALVETAPGWLRHIWLSLEKNPDQKHILFVDEVDKARDQVLSSTLSLFGSGEIKNWRLPAQVGILAAMNPPGAPLKPELMSRLMPISFPFADDQLTQGLSRIRSIALEYLTMPAQNWGTFDRKKNKGVAHRLESWFTVDAFWKSEGFRNIILKGLVPHKDIPWFQARLDPKTFLALDLTKWIESAGAADIREMLLPLLAESQDENERFATLEALCKRVSADPTGELAVAFTEVSRKLHKAVPPIKKAG